MLYIIPSFSLFITFLLLTRNNCLGAFQNQGAFSTFHHHTATASSCFQNSKPKIKCCHGGMSLTRSFDLVLKIHSQSDDQEKLDDFQGEFEEERSYDNFGILTPIAEKLDSVSGDWALSYADLSPSTPQTMEGRAFLATNVAYAIAGAILGTQGDWFFAGLIELAGAVSFWYHFNQLELGKDRSEVRFALLADYFTAGAALLTGIYYMADMGISSIPFNALLSGGGAIICLSLCWVWEFGYPYLFWHSLWHLGSAYTAYSIGQAHLDLL